MSTIAHFLIRMWRIRIREVVQKSFLMNYTVFIVPEVVQKGYCRKIWFAAYFLWVPEVAQTFVLKYSAIKRIVLEFLEFVWNSSLIQWVMSEVYVYTHGTVSWLVKAINCFEVTRGYPETCFRIILLWFTFFFQSFRSCRKFCSTVSP